ncbi:MAG: response regulator [Pseudomonadota bacterium]
MDTSIIYTKTAKGVLELKAGAKSLSGPVAAMLNRIDGRSSVAGLLLGRSETERGVSQKALATLEAQQLIKVFTRAAPPKELELELEPSALEMTDEHTAHESASLPLPEIAELSAEEGVLAWAEARRGARTLVQTGFYTTGTRMAGMLRAGDESLTLGQLLIVEDDEAISELMQAYLTRRGYTVRAVADGKQALDILDRLPIPDLVLLDVNLPYVNGFDILAYMRNHSLLKQIPAIMVTAQVSDADVLRGLKGGADGYVFKPFEWPVLNDCIKRVLASAGCSPT